MTFTLSPPPRQVKLSCLNPETAPLSCAYAYSNLITQRRRGGHTALMLVAIPWCFTITYYSHRMLRVGVGELDGAKDEEEDGAEEDQAHVGVCI